MQIKTYPRSIESSLRRKDEKRKKKREAKKLKKEQLLREKRLEVKQLKKRKKEEFRQRIEKLKEITGNSQFGFDVSPKNHPAFVIHSFSSNVKATSKWQHR